MNQFMKLALLSLVAISVVSCGNSGKKKKPAVKREKSIITDQSASSSNALKNKDELFHQKIERRLQFENEFAPQVYVAAKQDQGTLKLIFLPANPRSLNKNDHQALWFFNAKNDEESGIDAYEIELKDQGSSANTLAFELAPLDEELEDKIIDNGGSRLNLIDLDTIKVNCGDQSSLYIREKIATADNMSFHTLTAQNEDLYKSPCSFSKRTEEETEESTTTAVEVQNDPSEAVQTSETAETDIPIAHCSDSQEESIIDTEQESETQYIQSVGSIKVKGIVRCFHNTGKCVVIQSEIVSTHQAVPSSCIYTVENQTETQTTNENHNHESGLVEEVESVLLSDTDLPYCSASDQRSYLKKQEQAQDLKKEVLFNVNYCQLRPELGSLCRAQELHKLHLKIERRRKQMGRILNRCHKNKVKYSASGYNGRPEMNTCGIIGRIILTNKRVNVKRLEEKINDLKANCQLDPNMCSDKKMARYEKLLAKKQASIAKREKACNTNL